MAEPFRCLSGGAAVQLVNGPLDGEVVEWLPHWRRVEKFGGPSFTRLDPKLPGGTVRAVRIAPDLRHLMVCLIYERTEASGDGLAHFREEVD